jgi:hypothetical protein
MASVQPGYLEDAIRDAADAVDALHQALIRLDAAQAAAARAPHFCYGDWLYDTMADVVGVLEEIDIAKLEHILRSHWPQKFAEASR